MPMPLLSAMVSSSSSPPSIQDATPLFFQDGLVPFPGLPPPSPPALPRGAPAPPPQRPGPLISPGPPLGPGDRHDPAGEDREGPFPHLSDIADHPLGHEGGDPPA